ncbi:uncharacterized protein BDZ99DRAFT_502151 [Mytilinidion resinicola]|uniref:Uncharacterized protein n=1 Tax=Mytilinidion resinicola TaxID=574789 RepID=A0A6A6YBT8_9PEZI|nr:uncharacterized protein BDZ99DRAFT_502151 [Mytilinidion resinicola]KAF2805307.1 hypothetical protein BDZ99DRAFT_502151 [Mytilinidion resinicola]
MEASSKGRNLAVTKDGAKYNKLTRPDDLSDLIPKATSAAPPMDSAKRKLDELNPANADTDEEPHSKRARPSELPPQEEYHLAVASTQQREAIINTRKSIKPKLGARNEKYGQAQGIGPGLDEWDDGDATDSSTNEAMQYLRSVRQEADAIPVLVTAPAPEILEGESDEAIYNDGVGDMRAIFRDGVCMAARSDSSLTPTETSDECRGLAVPDISPQEAYRAMLLKELGGLRDSFSGTPPLEALDRLRAASKTLTTFNRLNHASMTRWNPILRHTYPTPTQISQMSHRTTMHLIAALAECLKPNRNITPQLSCWIWGLFGRIGERGTLQADDDYTVRELGKAAVAIRLSHLGYDVHRPSLDLDESDELGEDGYEPAEGQDSEHDEHNSEPDEESSTSLKAEDQDASAGTETKGQSTISVKPLDHHPQANPSLLKCESGSEDGEIADDDPSTVVSSIETAKGNIPSTLTVESPNPETSPQVDAAPKRERGPNITPRLPRNTRKAIVKKNNRARRERKKAERAEQASIGTKHPSTGPHGSNRSSYDPDRFVSSNPQLGTRRSVSNTHMNSNDATRGRQQTRNTSSPEPSPDPSRTRRNTSSPELSPGPYRRLRRTSTPDKQTFPSRAEAERSRLIQNNGAIPQVDGAKEHDVHVVKGGDDAMDVVMEPEVDDGEVEKEQCKEVEEEVPNMNTLATLDMIITIVGERYGQRDLLDAREVWQHAVEV